MLTFVYTVKFCFVNLYNNNWQKTIVLINNTFQLKAMAYSLQFGEGNLW